MTNGCVSRYCQRDVPPGAYVAAIRIPAPTMPKQTMNEGQVARSAAAISRGRNRSRNDASRSKKTTYSKSSGANIAPLSLLKTPAAAGIRYRW
jgi:hypothetical protein